MASCPNKSHPDWQALVNQVGEYTAMAMYRKNGGNIPNVIRDLKLSAKAQTGSPVQEGISNQQWINALKRLKAYNSKMGTAHRLNNSQLRKSTAEVSVRYGKETLEELLRPIDLKNFTVNSRGDKIPANLTFFGPADRSGNYNFPGQNRNKFEARIEPKNPLVLNMTEVWTVERLQDIISQGHDAIVVTDAIGEKVTETIPLDKSIIKIDSPTSTMYTYQVIENWNSALYKSDPVANNKTEQLDLFTDMLQIFPEEEIDSRIGRHNIPNHIKLEQSLQSFLQAIGVDVETVKGITDANGNPISAIAKANMLNRVIEVVEGKQGLDTLPEEAAHFFVRLLKVNNHPLYDSMKKEIRDYAVFEEVKEQYDEVYDSNVDALEEEAIGKLISKVLISQVTGEEIPEKVSRAKRWFDKVLAYLRKLVGRPSENPYKAAAMSIMNRDLNELKINTSLVDSNIGSTEFYALEDENVKLDVEKVADTLNEFENTNERFSTKKNVPLEDLEGQAEFAKWMVAEEGLVERYWDNVLNKVVANRATDRAGSIFVRRQGLEKAKEINSNRDNEIKRTGGTALHSTMERLMQLVMYKHGNRASILKDSGVSEEIFKRLEKSVKGIVKSSREQQAKIDPNGIFHIRPEQIVHDSDGKKGVTSQDTAGSIDLVVLYSDNSTDIYDYKFVTPKSDFVTGFGKGTKIVLNPFGIKMDGYHMQLSTYKDILKRKYGISKVRKSRIIPFHVEYKAKKIDGIYRLTNEIVNVQTASENEFLKQIPVANELFGDAGIDKLIKKFSARRNKLNKERKKLKANPERYEQLTSEITSLDSAVQNLRVGGGIGELFVAAAGKMQLLDRKSGVEQEFLDDGSINPDFMTWAELNDMTESFNLYSGIVGGITNLLRDLKTSDPAEFNKLNNLRRKYGPSIESAVQVLKDMQTQRIATDALDRGIQDATRASREIGTMGGLFNTASEFEHPIFRVAWSLIEQSQVNTMKDLNKLEKEIESQVTSLKEWSETNGMSLMDAYRSMINPETGNLTPMYTAEFWDILKEARSSKNIEWMKNHYQKKEGYQEQFDKWKERRFKKIEEDYADIYEEDQNGDRVRTESGSFVVIKDREKTRENMKQTWLSTHDLSRNSAWLNTRAYLHLEMKPEMQGQYHSEKYKYILANQPLLDFYTMYQEKNKEFSERTGHHIAGNFVANLRIDSVDAIAQGRTKETLKAALDGLKIHSNESDEINGVRNPVTGELEPQIPLLYLNPLQDSKGDVDNSMKNIDLARSLYLMGKTAFNYEQKNAVEDQILSLHDFLLDHESLLTDWKGEVKYDASGELATKESDASAIDIFKRLYINQGLYGQNVQGKDWAMGSFSGKKVLLGAKSLFGAKVLGLAVIPAVAAWGAGRLALNAVAKKGTFFTSKMSSNATKMFIKQDDTYNFLVNHFEIHQDNKSYRVANSLSTGLLAKTVSMDTLFLGFRKADEWNENNILVAMSQNYGVDAEGMPKRLEFLPEGSLSIKELGDIAAENAKEDKTFDMKLSEKGFIKFRGIARAVAGDIKGQTSSEDGNAANTYLLGNLAMQFKNWMPRIIRERVGGFKYRSATDTYEQGRYKVVSDEFWQEESAQKILMGALTTALKLSADAVTFGLAHKMSPDIKTTEKLFQKYKQENIDNPDIQQMDLKEFTDMRRGQLRAAASELRSLLGLFAATLILSLKGDDDEEMYKKTWATRQLYNSIRRTRTELGFTSNPGDWASTITRSSIPLSGLISDTIKALHNTGDVFMEDISGVEDKRDKTGRFYYTGPFIPGFKQLRRFFEATEQDKRAYQQ
jgi:hypothetical protein